MYFWKVEKIEYYEYIIITSQDIDQWCFNKIAANKTAFTSGKRHQQFRDKMSSPGISYSCYLLHMGTNTSWYIVLLKVPCYAWDRSEEKLIVCISQSSKEIPEFGNIKVLTNFYEKYKHGICGSAPFSILDYKYKDLMKDIAWSRSIRWNERILKYCLSNGD